MNTGQQALLFILKSFAFTVVWFFTWFFVLHPFAGLRQQMSSDVEAQEKQQSDKYAQMLNRSERQLAQVETQQKRMNAILSQYEQHAGRYEAVLQKWEQQTGIRK
jgi:uncharacterized protein involved in exopolysaccharide biosynthesis